MGKSKSAAETEKNHHEAIVIGAGVTGIYQIKRLTDMGMDAIVLEADEDLGGTWYRNRYPGCRFDSESYTYGYSFSREVINEWHWKERFSSQPENLRYLNLVADKFGLRQHMRFNSRVKSMIWDESSHQWDLTLTDGTKYTTNYVITGLGILTIPSFPKLSGIDTFKGQSFHTYHWPKEEVSLEGKRVGVIGTGATGIQVISAIADKVGELKVFQRRPNWSSPLNNSPISEAEMDDIRNRYDEIYQKCHSTPGGFEHEADRRGFDNFTPEERRKIWDKLYDTPGFALLSGNFSEIFVDEKANQELSDYVAERIRGRVNDPVIAEKLIPKDHGYGMQRVPLETKYFETYNRDNVELVDVTEAPIEAITETGIQTSDGHYDLDIIVYATGFDAVTGAFNRIDVQGVGGQTLAEKWSGSPSTCLGVMTNGFPNLIMVAGPQAASGASNMPRAIETIVDWVSDLLAFAKENNVTRMEPDISAEEDWGVEVKRMHEKMLFRKAKSWFTGYNPNLQGHAKGNHNPNVRYLSYWGGLTKYTAMLKAAKDQKYAQFGLTSNKKE